jgi:DDE superfamily endonuclease
MEDLLDVYMQPYDEGSPVVCIDERPCQLIGHVQPPVLPQPGHPTREDTEFSRNGACSTFLMFEPHLGWRHACVKETRTKRDFASCLKYLLDEKYAHVPKVRLVLDNLNTHTPAALYETFESQEALRLAKRIEWHYTPLHGSWLNMVEIELSVLANQCQNRRRIGDIDQLRREIAAWEQARNAQRATVQWRFTPSAARIKLKHLYPLHEEVS